MAGPASAGDLAYNEMLEAQGREKALQKRVERLEAALLYLARRTQPMFAFENLERDVGDILRAADGGERDG